MISIKSLSFSASKFKISGINKTECVLMYWLWTAGLLSGLSTDVLLSSERSAAWKPLQCIVGRLSFVITV